MRCGFMGMTKKASKSHLCGRTGELVSPLDLAPCHFCLLPELMTAVKGIGCTDVIMIEAKMWVALDKFQTVQSINCFEQWHDCWTCCMKSQGDYSEPLIRRCCC